MTILEILDVWSNWHKHQPLKLGYPSKSLAIASGGVNCWDDVERGIDGWIAGETESAVNDLPPDQHIVIHMQYVSNHSHAENKYIVSEHTLTKALETITSTLRRKGVVVDSERLQKC